MDLVSPPPELGQEGPQVLRGFAKSPARVSILFCLKEGMLSLNEAIPFESKLCRNLTSSSSSRSSGIYCRLDLHFFVVGGSFKFDSSLAGVRTRGAFTRIVFVPNFQCRRLGRSTDEDREKIATWRSFSYANSGETIKTLVLDGQGWK